MDDEELQAKANLLITLRDLWTRNLVDRDTLDIKIQALEDDIKSDIENPE